MSALDLCVLVVVFRRRKGIEEESEKPWLESNRGSKMSHPYLIPAVSLKALFLGWTYCRFGTEIITL